MNSKHDFFSVLLNSSKEICSSLFDVKDVYNDLLKCEGDLDKTVFEVTRIKDFFISYSELGLLERSKIKILSQIKDFPSTIEYVDCLGMGLVKKANAVFARAVLSRFNKYILAWLPIVIFCLLGIYGVNVKHAANQVENVTIEAFLAMPVFIFLCGFIGYLYFLIFNAKCGTRAINIIGFLLNPSFKKSTAKTNDFEIEEKSYHATLFNYLASLIGNEKDMSRVRMNESVLSDFDCLESDEQKSALEKGSKFSSVDIATIDDVYSPFANFMEHKFQQQFTNGGMSEHAKDNFRRWGKNLMPAFFLVTDLTSEQIKLARSIYFVSGFKEAINYVYILKKSSKEMASKFYYKKVHSVIASLLSKIWLGVSLSLMFLPYFFLTGNIKLVFQVFGLFALIMFFYTKKLADSYNKVSANRGDLRFMTKTFLIFREAKHVKNIEGNKQRHNFVFRNYLMLLGYVDVMTTTQKLPASTFNDRIKAIKEKIANEAAKN